VQVRVINHVHEYILKCLMFEELFFLCNSIVYLELAQEEQIYNVGKISLIFPNATGRKHADH